MIYHFSCRCAYNLHPTHLISTAFERCCLPQIGYFSSYWCKRQGEVYQQPEVAATINQRFIPVLVDREEHPDVDRMFMAASATMGCGSGGWPLHVMLTPESKPFFCAHFLETKPLHEMVGRISKIWRHDREQLIQLSDSASAQLLLTMEPSTVSHIYCSQTLTTSLAVRCARLIQLRWTYTHFGLW